MQLNLQTLEQDNYLKLSMWDHPWPVPSLELFLYSVWENAGCPDQNCDRDHTGAIRAEIHYPCVLPDIGNIVMLMNYSVHYLFQIPIHSENIYKVILKKKGWD